MLVARDRLVQSRRLFAGAFLLLALAASVSARAGGREAPPPPKPCTTDTDCGGCMRCTDGYCPEGETQNAQSCLCNAECELVGMHSCDLSLQKPLCGGRCVATEKTRELTCSAGDDRVKLEPLTTAITDNPAGASVVTEAGAIVVEVFQ